MSAPTPSDARLPAILLLGPTGAGKTPLGDLLEQRGFRGTKCLHFDFGDNLRRIAALEPIPKRGQAPRDGTSLQGPSATARSQSPFRDRPPELPRGRITQADVDLVKQVLQSGALLEDEQFPLAERILRSFLADRRADRQTLIVLNGLPRHAGQAAAIDRIVEMKAVISLECSGEVVVRRVRSNVGGDRTGRVDDDLDAVQRKLALFAQRTAPLVAHYRAREVPILVVEVGADTTPEQVRRAIEAMGR